jgi:hypothetical protein
MAPTSRSGLGVINLCLLKGLDRAAKRIFGVGWHVYLTIILEIMHFSVNELMIYLITLHLSLNDLLRRSVDLMRSAYTNHYQTVHFLYIYEIQWDRYIVWWSVASRRLYNILYFLWLYNEFFIILYNIIKIAELDCCQIIILSIYVPSTHAYTHVLRLSLDLLLELSNFCSSLDGIWTHTIDTLQHHSLSLTSSALDHSTTSTP